MKKLKKNTKKITIPERIKNLNFVLINPKGDGKNPLEKGWQKKEHRFDDDKLIKHLEKGFNYGIRGGKTSPIIIEGKSYFLLIVDFDKKDFQDKILPLLPETFTTTSGSEKKCYHLWFASDDDRSFKILDENKETLCDIIGEGKQVIAPGSKHKSGSSYSVVKDVPFAFIPFSELQAVLLPFDKTPKKPMKEKDIPFVKSINNDIAEKLLSSISMDNILSDFGIDTSKNPTNCPLHTSKHGKCFSWNNETAHCFHCQSDHEGWNKFSLVREVKKLSDKETFEWFAEKTGLGEELQKSRKEYAEKNQKENPGPKPDIKENHDLKTFIFEKDQIIQNRVFSSDLLSKDIFAFGIKLPRMEDIRDKKGNILGQHQVWRPVIITSDKRGLVVSKWMETEYKISYDCIPEEMPLRWELKDIDEYLHKDGKKIDGLKLFQRIKNEYDYYNYYREKCWYNINTLWDMATYFHQLFASFPLKEERGLKETGKTKTMAVSNKITLNATEIMTNPSEATLFRLTEDLRPTKYIDEAESLFKFTPRGIEPDNRVELINSSFSRNGAVPRQEKLNGVYVTKWYHVYSPTRISSINGLYGATESRALTQIHTKAPDKEVKGERDPENDINLPKWHEIRNECYLFALQNWKVVQEAYLSDIPTKLKKRDLQLWKPLIALACVIDKEKLLPDILSFAEKMARQKKIDALAEGTFDYKVLDCLNKVILESTSDRIYVNAIRNKFNDLYPTIKKNGDVEVKDVGFNKTISTKLDKIGFKEVKDKDDKGAYYQITKSIFDEIVSPITSDFSSNSSNSSEKEDKNYNKNDDSMTNLTNQDQGASDKSDEKDESDDGLTPKCDLCSSENAFISINNKMYCQKCAYEVAK